MKCQPIPISSWEQYQSGSYTIVIAKTPCQQQQGLQGTKFLDFNMLILFLNIKPRGNFHTRNCLFPIDIIALNSANKILHVWTARPGLNMVGPMPSETAKVLEAKGGWAQTLGLKVGDVIPFIKS